MREKSGKHILESLCRAERGRDRVQFVSPSGVRHSTFADLWSLSARAARTISASVPAGRIAGVLTPSAEMIACLVGSLRGGRDFVSLPLPGRGQSPAAYLEQLRTITTLANVSAVIVESAYVSALESSTGAPVAPLLVAEHLIESATSALQGEPEPGQLVQFSSGTTGTPKGVRLDGFAIDACVEAILAGLRIGRDPEVFCGWVPLSHDMGLIGGLLASWVGATRAPYRYVCTSPELFVARPSLWLETCAEHRATITAAPAFAYDIAARRLPRGPLLDLSALRAAIVGAEPIAAETLRAFDAAARSHGLRSTALCPAYGLAEATLAVSMVPPETPWSSRSVVADGQRGEYVSCGAILDSVRVDAPGREDGPGPIRVAGPALCSGYIPSRPQPPGLWLDTGDLGILVDGDLIVTGRSDDLLCLAGRNVFAWELERAAYALPHVRSGGCAVVSDGRGSYVALFEPVHGERADADRWLTDVRRQLGAVAGLGPSGVGCLPRGTLPKTPSGKTQRNSIASRIDELIASCVAYAEF
jgi:acyl-CoA synthetase (AMP-forming)/AMP-acid ligase II